MVELTSGMSLIVPFMVSALTAKFVGELIGVSGIYDAHIQLNGFPFLDNKEEYFYLTKACDVMTPRLIEFCVLGLS
jgi:chloride channel 3/4/5